MFADLQKYIAKTLRTPARTTTSYYHYCLFFWFESLAGHAAGPESLAECAPSVFQKLRKGSHIVAADGSTALQAAANVADVPSLKGVSHIRHLFSPLSAIPKKGLVQDELKLLRHLSQQGCCKETRSGFLMVGGDNVAESIASITKSQLRRFGLSKVSRDGIEHRNVLAVHHINQRPGLATVLDALKKHRSLASRSFLSPSQVFKQPLWQV